MKKLRIGLFGLDYTNNNMGCQALAYSFFGILSSLLCRNEIVGDVTIFISKRYLDPETKPFGVYKNMTCKTIAFRDRQIVELTKAIKQQDLCIHFTGGDSFSDIYGSRRFIIGTLQKSLSQLNHIPLILGPQTYGPYHHSIYRNWAYHVIRHAKATFARDDLSYQRISKLKKANIFMATDVAFSLPYNHEYRIKREKKKLIGINISGLLYEGGYTQNNQFHLKVDYVMYCKQIIEYLHKTDTYDIYLVPHVVGKSLEQVDNDTTVCYKLQKQYPFCKMAPEFNNPMEAKSFISCLDFFIGARMHATIAAFSTGVLTIPFSYSVKFEGLYQGLGFNYCINGRELSTEEAIQTTIKYINNEEQLRYDLQKSLLIANQRLEKFINTMEQVILQCHSADDASSKAKKESRKSNVYHEYCIGCGLCGSIKGAEMITDHKGFLKPVMINQDFVEKVCPINYDFSGYSSKQQIWGKSVGVYVGYAKDVEVRKKASSGGILTALGEYLIDHHLVDGIIHTGADPEYPLKTKTFCSETSAEVRLRMGSRYGISSPLSDFLKYVKEGKRYAFIGKPCDVQALRNLIKYEPKYKKVFPYLLSFFCAGMPSDNANQKLVKTMGCHSEQISSIDYRGNGWPGLATVKDTEGKEYTLDYATSWGSILGRDKNKFCRLCMDGIGLASDIVCGDAWFMKENQPDFSEHEGRNVIIVRNQKGIELLKGAYENHYIEYQPYIGYYNEMQITQSYQFQRKAMIEPQISALKLFHKSIPPCSQKELHVYRRKDVDTKKIFWGTVKRIIKGTY